MAAAATLRDLVSNKASIGMIVAYSVVGLFLAALAAWLIYTFVLKSPTAAAPHSMSVSDCQYGTWSDWIGCDAGSPAACGAGVGVRMRGIVQEAENGGAQCDESQMVDTSACTVLNAGMCANVNCSYTSWSAWSACPTQTCESTNGSCVPQGIASRTRAIYHEGQPAHGGTACDIMQTFEYAPCEGGVVCPEPVDCVPQDWSASIWSGCPTDACVLPGQPAATVWEYQYRGISVTAQYGGKECSLSSFVRSQTCALPTCTSCTIAQWGAWSACDVPCTTPARPGVQWQQADVVDTGNYFYCDSTSVTTCSDVGACPTGAFSLTMKNAVGCTAPMAPGTDGLTATAWSLPASSITLADALALCAGAPSCAAVAFNGGAGKTWASAQLFTSAAGCTEAGTPTGWQLYEWDAASNNCVPPTWPMLDAECLNLCAGGQLPPHGRVYSFAGQLMPDGVTPALSCPITLDLLQAAGACAPDAAGTFTSLSCKGSSDCVYQNWADAGVWSVCDAPCGVQTGGGGTRQRTRNIVAPASFMGAACNLDEVVEYAACHSPSAYTATPGLACVATASSTPYTNGSAWVSSDACQDGCKNVAGDSCTSFNFACADSLREAAAAGQEIFYAAWQGGPASRASNDTHLAAAVASGADWRYAGLDEVQVVTHAGASWCAPGYTSGMGNVVVAPGCQAAGSLTIASASVAGAILVGTKPSASAAAAMNMTVAPFAPGTWSMPSGILPTTSSVGVCSLQTSMSTDDMLRANTCAPAYASLSLVTDAPCGVAIPCSLSSWTDFTTCPTCGPPFYKWQTRDYLFPPQHGGTPCDQFVTKQSVSCVPAPVSCSSLLTESVYGPWPSTQAAGTAPCLAASGVAYHESWDVPVQSAWIAMGAYDALNTYWPSATTSTSVLPQDLADALNSQCLGSKGAPTCIATDKGTYSMFTTQSNSQYYYAGWKQAACTPDPGFTTCLATRPTCSHLTYSPEKGTCFCPSLCPYDMSLCSFSTCSAVCADTDGTRYMTRSMLQGGADFSPAQLVWTLPCTGAPTLPSCPKACSYSTDGSMCASLSGHGYCDLSTGACVCQPGYETQTCWYGCPVDAAGVQCAGHGTCTELGECACDAGFGGFNCSIDTRPALWNYDEAMGVAVHGCINDWTKCDRCDTVDTVGTHLAPMLSIASPFVTSDVSYLETGTTCEALGFTQSSVPLGYTATGTVLLPNSIPQYNKPLGMPPQPAHTDLSGTWTATNNMYYFSLTSVGLTRYQFSLANGSSNAGVPILVVGFMQVMEDYSIIVAASQMSYGYPYFSFQGTIDPQCGSMTFTFPPWTNPLSPMGTLTFTPSAAPTTCVIPDMRVPPSQVYFATYSPRPPSISLAQAQDIAAHLGGQIATEEQLTSATQAGAQWCEGGWVSDSPTHWYPMQYAVPGVCSFAGKGIPTAGPATGVVIFGPKPSPSAVPSTLSVAPWYSNMSSSDPNPTTWNAPNI
jgi:hypothetical protein